MLHPAFRRAREQSQIARDALQIQNEMPSEDTLLEKIAYELSDIKFILEKPRKPDCKKAADDPSSTSPEAPHPNLE